MATYYWVGGSGTWDNSSKTNWAASSGGAGGVGPPLSTDNVNFDSNSGTAAVVNVTGTAVCLSCTVNKSDINLSLSGNPVMSNVLTLTAGSITLNSYTLKCVTFSSDNSNARTLDFGSGVIEITGNGGNVWLCNTINNFTITGTPIVNATYSGASATRTFRHGNTSGGSASTAISVNIKAGTDTVSLFAGYYNNVDFTGFAGSLTGSAITVYGNMTYSTGMTIAASSNTTTFAATSGIKLITTNGRTIDCPLTFNGVGGTFRFEDNLVMGTTRALTLTNGTLQLKAGTTNTVGSFVTSGTTMKYLASTTPGTQATISDASGTNSVSYLTIQDSVATGGATWQAYLTNNNADAGNNLGWDFALQLGKYMYSRRKNKRILP